MDRLNYSESVPSPITTWGKFNGMNSDESGFYFQDRDSKEWKRLEHSKLQIVVIGVYASLKGYNQNLGIGYSTP